MHSNVHFLHVSMRIFFFKIFRSVSATQFSPKCVSKMYQTSFFQVQNKCMYHFRSAIFLGKKKPQSLRVTSQQSCSVTGIRPMRTNLKSPTKASFRGLFNFIHARLIAFVQIRDCGIYLILIIDYSIIIATLPEPTVLPPSRIANPRPCSIAIG